MPLECAEPGWTEGPLREGPDESDDRGEEDLEGRSFRNQVGESAVRRWRLGGQGFTLTSLHIVVQLVQSISCWTLLRIRHYVDDCSLV